MLRTFGAWLIRWLRAASLSRRFWGILLQAATVGFAVLLAVLGGGKEQPSKATNALIVVLVAVAQVGAGWAFSGEGKADPALAERSVSRLFQLASRAEQAEQKAQRDFESTVPEDPLHANMGILSTELSWIAEGLVQAIGDWRTFHPQAVGRAEGTVESG
jgi:hypothetical protein